MATPAKKAAAKKVAETKPEESKESRLRAAYSAATQALREQHREDFNRLYAAEAKQRGVDWKPKPTARERAEAQLAALLAEHPDLLPQTGVEAPVTPENPA